MKKSMKMAKKIIGFFAVKSAKFVVGQHHYVVFASPKNLSYSETIL